MRKNKIAIVGVSVLVIALVTLAGCGLDMKKIMPLWSDSAPELKTEETTKPVVAVPEKLEAESTRKPEAVLEETSEAQEEAVFKPEEDISEPGPEIVTIKISAAGDCSLGNHHLQDYSGTFREMYDKQQNDAYFFENVYDIFSQDDMTIVNLEGVLTLSDALNEGRTYNIKGDPDYAKILTAGSVEAVSMANNHRLDYGEGGTKDTVEALEKEGIVYAYDKNVGIYEVKGIRIGIVSVNQASMGEYADTLAKEGIEKLKEENVDLLFACCHWGIEREFYADENQRRLGQKCIDWGADLVIGHHPHVLQGIEEYQGKYIIYSLANFCFGANRNPVDKDTMIFQQTFTFVDGEKTEDTEINIIPCLVSSVKDRNDYKPTPAIGDDAQRILDRITQYPMLQ